MVGSALQRSLRSKSGFDKKRIPDKYTLNQGHVTHFYDKGRYLRNRYDELIDEMKARGMHPDPSRTFPIEHFPPCFYNDWEPTEEDMEVARERINYRISQKPGWYRKYGKYLTETDT